MTDALKSDYEPMEISPQVSEGSEGEPMDVECINEEEISTEPPCRSGNTQGNNLKDTKNLRQGNKSETVETSKMILRKRNKGSELNNNNLAEENDELPRSSTRSSTNKGSAGVKNLRKRRKTERSEKDSPERDKDSKPYSLSAKGHIGDLGEFKVSIKLKRNVKTKRRS